MSLIHLFQIRFFFPPFSFVFFIHFEGGKKRNSLVLKRGKQGHLDLSINRFNPLFSFTFFFFICVIIRFFFFFFFL